jgi:hypothetical protein
MNNRRKIRRYDLSFPARIRLKGIKLFSWSPGRTHDISSKGVYLRAHDRIPVGSDVEMYFTVPAEFTLGAAVLIHAFGRVLRVEDQHYAGDMIGFAAIIEQYDITRS